MQLPSPSVDNAQMKELHPRFRFHTGDWLTHHLVVTHCQAMSRSFHELGEDPDIMVYKRILNREEQRESRRTLKPRIEPPKQPVLPTGRQSARMQKALPMR